jgi:hypothetical protein
MEHGVKAHNPAMNQPLAMLLDILKNQNRQKTEQADRTTPSAVNRTPPRGPRPQKNAC